MAKSLDDLDPDFRRNVSAVLATCEARGVIMRPFYTLRTPQEQAVLWRQSRGIDEINRAHASLVSAGALWLAEILMDVGPQHGQPVTNSLPGNSWHQWGIACDCFWLHDGNADWNSNGHGYAVYADVANSAGLTAGFYWTSFQDSVHIQADKLNSPRDRFPWTQIDAEMKRDFE